MTPTSDRSSTFEPSVTLAGPGGSDSSAPAARHGGPDAIGLRLHRELSKSIYAHALRLQVRLGDDTASGRPWLAEARRLVQRLVDLVHEDDTTLVGLTTLKSVETPDGRRVRTHAVNVAILSLVLARQAGLARPALAELGLAALLHDVGLDATEDAALHNLHGAEFLLQLGPIECAVRPALVALEHHEDGSTNDCDSATRVVQIADAYDTLTARGGAAATPDRALAFLLREGGAHYDRTLVKALASALGVYPPGTVVQLENQEVGVVLRANRDPKLIDRPLVQILFDAHGRPYGTVRTVDVATRDDHGFVTAIRNALAAQPRGLAAARVFLGAL